MEDESETRMIVISPSSEVTPDQVVRFVHSLGRPLTIKETCYGAMVEGRKEDVRAALEAVRKLDPNRIFSKIRGFPIGDTRRCRAHHGSRPGFTQLEKEWKDLALVEKGLAASGKCEVPERKKRKRIPFSKLKDIVEEVTK